MISMLFERFIVHPVVLPVTPSHQLLGGTTMQPLPCFAPDQALGCITFLERCALESAVTQSARPTEPPTRRRQGCKQVFRIHAKDCRRTITWNSENVRFFHDPTTHSTVASCGLILVPDHWTVWALQYSMGAGNNHLRETNRANDVDMQPEQAKMQCTPQRNSGAQRRN